MAVQITRTDEELQDAWNRAQKAAFDAEDAGETDDAASAVYDLFQWMTGNSDADPTAEMGDAGYEDE